ncbi:MAG: hypothetical protein KJ944_19375 [Alphaproteobacteria bacterium]|nr:hypothetical protein [Alphaproteobacteria bacterium]MBU1560777.1 hypothetical protein [Alphaproteobacteria bacterium]MBU2304751.1 hypothetical protein [Alphaproteobacteria bacterium]MBU2370047.1 hypothetical protein [Alphaproteobacteria bacterium]
MTKIKGHTVGSDGIVYNPDTASFGYVSSMDSRNENNSSDERGALVTDQGRVVPVHNVAALTVSTSGSGSAGSGPGAVAVATAPGGGGSGPGAAGAGVSAVPGAGGGKLKSKLQVTHTQMMVGGNLLSHDAGWSDAGEAEERWGEGEFLSPSWFYAWGVSGADVLKNLGSAFPAVKPPEDAVRLQERDAAYDLAFPGRVGTDGVTWRTMGGF